MDAKWQWSGRNFDTKALNWTEYCNFRLYLTNKANNNVSI